MRQIGADGLDDIQTDRARPREVGTRLARAADDDERRRAFDRPGAQARESRQAVELAVQA